MEVDRWSGDGAMYRSDSDLAVDRQVARYGEGHR